MKNAYKQQPRAIRLSVACLIAIAIGIASPFLMYRTLSPTSALQPDTNQPSESQAISGDLSKGTPDFDTVLPSGKSISEFGGWTRVSPPNRDAVYAYADKIGAIPIIVSQQPLPKDFSDQTSEQIQQLAQGYAANKKLNVDGSIVYVGTSAKGPQSVIVVKDKLLILIKASAAVSDEQWQKYIQSLG